MIQEKPDEVEKEVLIENEITDFNIELLQPAKTENPEKILESNPEAVLDFPTSQQGSHNLESTEPVTSTTWEEERRGYIQEIEKLHIEMATRNLSATKTKTTKATPKKKKTTTKASKRTKKVEEDPELSRRRLLAEELAQRRMLAEELSQRRFLSDDLAAPRRMLPEDPAILHRRAIPDETTLTQRRMLPEDSLYPRRVWYNDRMPRTEQTTQYMYEDDMGADYRPRRRPILYK